MKVITPIQRRAGTTRDQFRDYYENKHAPLGTRYFPFEKYVRNHVVGSMPDTLGFDVLMECWLDRGKAMALLTGEIDAVFAEDEARFMNAPPRPEGIDVIEHLIAGPPRGVDPRGLRKTACLLRKSPEISQSEFLKRAGDLGISLGANSPAERITLDEVLPGHAAPGFTADAVLTVWQSGGSIQAPVPPQGIEIEATISLASHETTPAELAAAFGT